jgi:membrane protease YdiL (CAAX protease family)
VASFVLAPLDTAIYKALFAWMPAGSLSGYSESVVVTTFAVSIVFVGLVGPAVEELYFRGFLLPRMAHLGTKAPILNAVLFSLYHFWTPWQFFSLIGFFLPTIWVTWRTKDLRVSLWVHCLANTLVQTLVLGTILSAS